MNEPGYEDGTWTLKLDGGPALMLNAVAALTLAIEAATPNGPRAMVLARLREACIEASPE